MVFERLTTVMTGNRVVRGRAVGREIYRTSFRVFHLRTTMLGLINEESSMDYNTLDELPISICYVQTRHRCLAPTRFRTAAEVNSGATFEQEERYLENFPRTSSETVSRSNNLPTAEDKSHAVNAYMFLFRRRLGGWGREALGYHDLACSP